VVADRHNKPRIDKAAEAAARSWDAPQRFLENNDRRIFLMLLASSVRRFGRSIKRIGDTYYPGFLLGFPLKEDEIPVFVYHDVEPAVFAEDLAFLRDNGYRTLSTDEFLQARQNGTGRRSSVLLTFDDARRNFWEVAFPLLCQFDARATLFVPTCWIGERGAASGDLDAVPSETGMFMTWEQIRGCVRSGLVDVQSHAHRHALVYSSTRLAGFASPGLSAHYDIYEWPMRRNDALGRPPWGTPIYEATPLLSADARFLEPPAAARACVEFVAQAGGEAFFSAPNWAAQLRKVHDESSGRGMQLMEQSRFEALVSSEFVLSRQLFEAELGFVPRYFAFPWRVGSKKSIELALAAEMQAIFGVGLDFRRARKTNGPLPLFGRFKGDWLRFLPGRGRSSLREVLPGKLRGFLRHQHFAH
jgi:peptidoglycan/xylan/chitin deacetylase (PgdA/CDA1 family)